MKNLPQSILDRLHKISKERGEDYNLILRRFAYEGFLRRLEKSRHHRSLILKGAFLTMHWTGSYFRPTKDMDMLAYVVNSEDTILKMLIEICAIEESDSLRFETDSMKLEEIRVDETYQGLRAKFPAYIGSTTRIPLQIDLGFGDPVTPEVVEMEYPTLLDFPAPHVLSYSPETVIAEKVETMVSKGMPNSRMKDYYDVYALSKALDLDRKTLRIAIEETFRRRQTDIPPGIPGGLSDEFAADDVKNAQWKAFIRKNELSEAPEDLVDVVFEIRSLVLPIFEQINGLSSHKIEKGKEIDHP